jgi:hypothetical protein
VGETTPENLPRKMFLAIDLLVFTALMNLLILRSSQWASCLDLEEGPCKCCEASERFHLMERKGDAALFPGGL